MLLTLATLALSSAWAQDCRDLERALADASPASVDDAFSDLADCDADAAKGAAADALDRVLSGSDGDALAVRAIEVGASEQAREWITNLQSDERSSAVAKLGASCDGNAAVAAFLVETRSVLGEDFWTDRWYRSLSNCREPAIQQLLSEKLANPGANKTLFFGVLEVYARNLAGDAVPRLEQLAGELTDSEDLTYVVNAFADAAQVGSVDGMDAETAAASVAAIGRIAPTLPPRVVDVARTTVISLGDQAASDALAGVRFAESKWDDGRLHYGLIALEVTECKKGDTWLNVHTGAISEAGGVWPDQLLDPATAAVEGGWELKQAKKCKGATELELILPAEPQADQGTIDAWVKDQLKELEDRAADKRSDTEEESLSL